MENMPTKKYEIKNINKCRSRVGMKKLNIKKRKCLKCNKRFESEGNHNRICELCKRRNAYSYSNIPDMIVMDH